MIILHFSEFRILCRSYNFTSLHLNESFVTKYSITIFGTVYHDIVITALETLIKQIIFPSFSDGEGSFDPEEAAIVYHMICTSPTAARYTIFIALPV